MHVLTCYCISVVVQTHLLWMLSGEAFIEENAGEVCCQFGCALASSHLVGIVKEEL